MKEEDKNFKKQVDSDWDLKYTLSPEAFKQLIADKIRRYSITDRNKLSERERQAWLAD